MASGRKKTRIPIDGKALSAVIRRKGLTQKDVSDQVHLSRETVNRAIKQNELDPAALDDICRLINVNPKYITGEERVKRDELVKSFKAKSKVPELIDQTIPPADENGYIIFSYDEYEKANNKSIGYFVLWLMSASSADIGYFENVPDARIKLVEKLQDLDDFQIMTLQDKLITSTMHYIDEGKLDYPQILSLLLEGDE